MLGITPNRFAEIAQLIDAKKVAASSAGALFDRLIECDQPAEAIARRQALESFCLLMLNLNEFLYVD